MKMPQPVTVDFETETSAAERPHHYPPKPIGVSIKYWGKAPRYYAFGHTHENNSTLAEARSATKQAWKVGDGILCHRGGFDVDVANEHFGLPVPRWDRVHDTVFLLYLDDPHQMDLGLKPSAERLLKMKPGERDAVLDWLLAHQPVPGVRISKSRQSDHYYMGYLKYAPGNLVGEYANGDTVREEALYKLLWARIRDRKMLQPYDRERKLMPILLKMERGGLPVGLERLQRDVTRYNRARDAVNVWVLKQLRASPDLNLDSGEQLVDAMIRAKKCDPRKMPKTATGKVSTAKASLLLGVTDKTLLGVLRYRTQLNTCLGTFMEPWLGTAKQSGGLIYTQWNQTKQPEGGGTRTGRLSSTPNFQNMPKEFAPIFKHEVGALLRKSFPSAPFALPPLPRCRSYIQPFPHERLVDRDYSQQEPRILAHFDGGALMQKYLDNPWIDFHDYAKAELEKMGLFYERRPVKNTNLGLIYGLGVGMLAERNGMEVDEAKKLKQAVLSLYPGLAQMYRDMKLRAKQELPIRTWGGREYYCEPPRLVEGRIRHFDYKLINVLIQGSAADATKEAIIRWDAAADAAWRLLLNVHDQLTSSTPKRSWRDAMRCLQEVMESVEFDVKLLTEGSTSDTNFDELKPYDKKGVVL